LARGKYLSLEEARKMKGGLKRFAKEHPSVDDEAEFDRALNAMAGGKPKANRPIQVRSGLCRPGPYFSWGGSGAEEFL